MQINVYVNSAQITNGPTKQQHVELKDCQLCYKSYQSIMRKFGKRETNIGKVTNKRAPSGRDPRLRGKVIQTIISKYNMPKDYNYHCSFVWSYNNENVYFRLFSLCIKHIKL